MSHYNKQTKNKNQKNKQKQKKAIIQLDGCYCMHDPTVLWHDDDAIKSDGQPDNNFWFPIPALMGSCCANKRKKLQTVSK